MRYQSWIASIVVASVIACSSSMGPSGGAAGGVGGGGGGGYGGGGGTTGGHTTMITVANNAFKPTPDTIPAGGVTFIWSTPSNGHTLIWDNGPGTLPPDYPTVMTSGSIVAPGLQTGTYEFHCRIHGGPGTGMHGTLVVQ
jgi:plastocyanin